MARKNALITVAHNAETSTLTFTVGDVGSFDLPVNGLSDDVRNRATVHGLVQKVSDAAAMPKSETDGKKPEAVAKMKFDAMVAVADRLREGEWSKRSGDGSGPVAGVIYRAFEEWVLSNPNNAPKSKIPTPEKIREVYDAKSRAEQLALRNVPEIASIIERIKSERGSKSETVDTTALLGELGI